MSHETINHPGWYNKSPSGVECITVVEHMSFNLGNATKYVWRAGLKSPDPITDLEKARWYIEREIGRLRQAAVQPRPDDASLDPPSVCYTTTTNYRDV